MDDTPLFFSGVFTDPAEVERMRATMKRWPMNMDYRPPRAKRTPRRYSPSLMAHRPCWRRPAASESPL